MIRYLDVNAVTALIRKIGMGTALAALAGYMVNDFRRWGEFDKSARIASHSPLGVIELMPISDRTLYAFKYVNGHPENTGRGLSTVMAFGILAEVATGIPLLLSEMTIATGLRTAATSALAASYMARKNSKIMAVVGCGAQSEFQILAFREILGIKEFQLYDIDPAAIDKLRNNLANIEDISLHVAPSLREAVRGADIVTTMTAAKVRAALITPDMLESGMHINAIGGDCPGKTEIHPDVLKVARVAVEYEPQTRIEGDIQQMPRDFPVIELWKLVADAEPGRQNDEQITLFDGVGFALEDFSALRYFNDMAAAHNIGSYLNLIPSLADSKDLYSLLQNLPLADPLALSVNESGD